MTFVIAEIGVNFRDLVDADQMIQAAALAGADACKFQVFKEEHIKGHPREDELKRIVLTESDIRFLYWRCQQHGVEFMATPFYPEAVKILDPYVKRWKVRYGDRSSAIVDLCKETGKEVLVSSDGILPMEGCKRLFCVSEYPPGLKDYVEFEWWEKFDGFSCHYPNIGMAASPFERNNLKYLEVHVRLDYYELPHYCPIDTAVSITMSELEYLCGVLKE